MDKKYIASTLPLQTGTVEKLTAVQKELTVRFGFAPSRSETVDYLLKFYADHTLSSFASVLAKTAT